MYDYISFIIYMRTNSKYYFRIIFITAMAPFRI